MKKTTVTDILLNILENNGVKDVPRLLEEFEKFRKGERVSVPLDLMSGDEWEKIPPQLTTSYISMDSTIAHFLFYMTNFVSVHEKRRDGQTWKEVLHSLLIDQEHTVKRYHRKGVEVLVFSEVLFDYMKRFGGDTRIVTDTWEDTPLFTPPMNEVSPFSGGTPFDSVHMTSLFSKYVRRLRVDIQNGKKFDSLHDTPHPTDLPRQVTVRGERIFTEVLGSSCAIQTEFYLDSPLRLLKFPSMRKIAKGLGVSYSSLLSMFRLQKSGLVNNVVDSDLFFETTIDQLSRDMEDRTSIFREDKQ